MTACPSSVTESKWKRNGTGISPTMGMNSQTRRRTATFALRSVPVAWMVGDPNSQVDGLERPRIPS